MSSEELRQAAALMRERAEAAAFANGERWGVYRLEQEPNRWAMVGIGVEGDDQGHRAEAMFAEDAIHIASWHPAVALAVADWLESEAQAHFHIGDEVRSVYDQPNMGGPALAVARAYLGTAS